MSRGLAITTRKLALVFFLCVGTSSCQFDDTKFLPPKLFARMRTVSRTKVTDLFPKIAKTAKSVKVFNVTVQCITEKVFRNGNFTLRSAISYLRVTHPARLMPGKARST